MSKKKTHEEYIKEVANINPNIEVVGVYVNARTKILHRCKIDGHEWNVSPNSILNGYGCPKCGLKTISNKSRQTHSGYVDRVSKSNPNIEVVGTYIRSNIPILHRCKIDGYEWMARPSNILFGYGCPKCGGTMKKTHEEYVDELKDKKPNIEVVGVYIDTHTPILHRCRIDGYEWCATPSHVLNNTGCPMCGKMSQIQKRRKTHDEYVKEVNDINQNVEILGKYVNNQTKILHRCRLCGYEWDIIPANILNGQSCPRCRMSHGESRIEKYLIDHNIRYISQCKFDNCKNKRPLPFDFYLPDYNTCIEYDGIQHYEPVDFAGMGELWANKSLERTKHNDEIKNNYCKNNNIMLIRIKYDESVEIILNSFFNERQIKGKVF